jgi:hypothetical protein
MTKHSPRPDEFSIGNELFWTLKRTARELRRTPKTVRALTKVPGGIPHVAFSREILFRPAAIAEWMVAQERTPNPPRRRR